MKTGGGGDQLTLLLCLKLHRQAPLKYAISTKVTMCTNTNFKMRQLSWESLCRVAVCQGAVRLQVQILVKPELLSLSCERMKQVSC